MSSEAKITLSAAGVSQVVAAFKKVQSESGQTAKAVDALNRTLGGLKAIAAAVGVGKLVLDTINAADAVGDLARTTGNTTETISLFAAAAKESGVSMEAMSKSIRTINQNLDALNGGDKQAVELFNRIGLSAKDFKGLNADESLKKVALRIGQMEGSAATTAVAMKLLGKNGLETIEVFQKMSDEGIDPLMKRLKEAGVIFSQEFSDAADKAKKSLAQLQLQAQAATTQFLSGFLPAIKDVTDALGELNTKDSKLAEIGKDVGVVFKLAFQAVVLLASDLHFIVKQILLDIIAAGERLEALVKFDFQKRREIGEARARESAEDRRKLDKFQDELVNPPRKQQFFSDAGFDASTGKKGRTTKDAVNTADLQKRAKALEELERAAIENRQKLFLADLALRTDAAKRDYENGKTSLSQYYDKRFELLTESNNKEMAALEAQKKEIEKRATPDDEARLKREKDLADIKAKIAIQDIESKRESLALGDEERKAELALQETTRDFFGQQKAATEAMLNDLVEAEDTVRRLVATGVIGQAEGEQRILALRQQSLPVLEAMAEAMGALAITPEQIEAWRKFKETLKDVKVAAGTVGQDIAAVRATIKAEGVSAGASFFEDVITGAKSASEAVQSFAKSVLASFARVLSQKLAEKLFGNMFSGTSSILGLFGGGSGAAVKAAGGGLIQGPGTGTSDSIPAMLSRGEFVVRAAAVNQPGMEELLRTINMQVRPISSFSRINVPKYAAGGMVGGGQSGGGNYVSGPVSVSITPEMAHLSLKDWVENYLAREMANR